MGITGYQWQISPTPSTFFDFGYYASAYFSVADVYRVSVRATSACGTGQWADFYITVGSPSRVYPNPANDILNVEVDYAKTQGTIINYDIRLYDGLGNQVRQTTTNRSTIAQVSVSGLPNGIYYLHIYDGVGSKPDIHRIVVQH